MVRDVSRMTSARHPGYEIGFSLACVGQAVYGGSRSG
jgi:hypothetical protein